MKPQTSWEKWAQLDPYYAVLTDARFRRHSIDSSHNEFFVTGESFISRSLERYEANFGKLKLGRALDYGCGVGRLSVALSSRFKEVTASDVSMTMIQEAKKNAALFGADNIDFVLSGDGKIDGEFDYINTYIVLQHIPVKRGLNIIKNLIIRVKPGGGFLLHVSAHDPSIIASLACWTRENIPGVNIIYNAIRNRPLREPPMQMNSYPLAKVFNILRSHGVSQALVLPEVHGGYFTVTIIGQRDGV
jgi:SAM-dependent methyltransferase